MYKKINSIKCLENYGLNVHKYVIPQNKKEYIDTLKEFGQSTIRFDHMDKTFHLPFYIFHINKDNNQFANQIWTEKEKGHYKIIIANGIKYDPIQEYNMAVKFTKEGEFMLEASPRKVPLRHMYRYPMLSCSGYIWNKPKDWEFYNKIYGIDYLEIYNDLFILYQKQIYDKWLEVTKYPIPVGNLYERMVFWQIA